MLGWEQAFWTVILWGIANVYHAFAASQLGVQPLVFTCITFLSAALVLVLIGGKGFLVKATFKSPSTWVYSFVSAVTYILAIYLFQMVTATEGSLLRRLSIVIALFVGFYVFKRKVSYKVTLGAIIIFLGIATVIYGLPMVNIVPVCLILLIASGFQVLQLIVAEKHPQTNRARHVREECRVVGIVMCVLSTAFLVVSLILSFILPNTIGHGFIPQAVDFAHLPTLISGLIFGVVLVGPIKYLEFTSVRKIKTENFLAMAAFAPLVTFVFEAVASTIPLSGMTIHPISFLDIVAALCVILSAFYIAWQQLRHDFVLYRDRKNKEEFSFREFMQYTEKNAEVVCAHASTVREKDDEALKKDLEMKRVEMDMISLKRQRAAELSNAEKDLIREQEHKNLRETKK